MGLSPPSGSFTTIWPGTSVQSGFRVRQATGVQRHEPVNGSEGGPRPTLPCGTPVCYHCRCHCQGFPEFRPSGPPLASQRRTSSVVAPGVASALRGPRPALACQRSEPISLTRSRPDSHASRVRVDWRVGDHAARAPAASFRAGTDAPDRPAARVARHDIVRGVVRCRGGRCRHNVKPGTPRWRLMPAFSHHEAFGWRRRQVMARTSSKRWSTVPPAKRSLPQ